MRQQIPRRSTLKVAAAAAAAASLAVGAAVFIFPGGWRGGTALLWAALVSALVVSFVFPLYSWFVSLSRRIGTGAPPPPSPAGALAPAGVHFSLAAADEGEPSSPSQAGRPAGDGPPPGAVEELQAILRPLMRLIRGSDTVDGVLEGSVGLLTDELGRRCNVKCAFVHMVGDGRAVLRAHRGMADDVATELGSLPFGVGFVWKTILEGSPQGGSCQGDGAASELCGVLGAGCVMGYPLRSGGTVVGALTVASRPGEEFGPGEERLLRLVAEHVEVALAGAMRAEAMTRSEEELREKVERLERKSRYETIVNQVASTVHSSTDLHDVYENAVEALSANVEAVDNVSIFIVEGTNAVLKAWRGYPEWFIRKVRTIPYPKGFTLRVLIEGRPRYVADVTKDDVIGPAGRQVGTRSYVGMPIKDRHGVSIGTININSLTPDAFGEDELGLLATVARQIELAIDNARTTAALRESENRLRANLEELERRIRYDAILEAVASTVHRSLDLDEVLSSAVDAVYSNMPSVEHIGIFLVDGQAAVLRAHRGYPTWLVERVRRIPYPVGFTWRMIMDGRTRYVADAENDPYIGRAGRELGTRSYLAIPLHEDGKTVGCIDINSLRRDAFSGNEIDLLERVARHIEIAIANARRNELLREREEELRRNLEELREKSRFERIVATVTRSVHSTIDLSEVLENAVKAIRDNIEEVEHVAIFLVEGEGVAVLKAQQGLPRWLQERVSRVPRPRGFVWRSMLEGRPRYVDDVDRDDAIGPAGREAGIKSYLAVPLRMDERVVGCIAMTSTRRGGVTRGVLQMLEMVARQLEVAIGNASYAESLARSREELRKRGDQRSALVMLGEMAVGGVELDELFEAATQVVAETLGVEYAKVLEYRSGPRAEFVVKTAVGWVPGMKGTGRLYVETRTPEWYALSNRGAQVIEDLPSDERYSRSQLFEHYGIRSGVVTAIEGVGGVYGVLGAYSTLRRTFTPDEMSFVVGAANVLAQAIKRREAERELIERNRELEAAHTKLRDATQKLIQSEKMSAVGLVAAGIAHELNNPAMGILNFIQYAIKHTDPNDKRYEVLRNAEREMLRCIDILRNLLTFSHMERRGGQLARVHFFDVIDRAVSLVTYRLHDMGIEVEKVGDADAYVMADEGEMQQVVLNLLVNAIDALEGVRDPRVVFRVAKSGGMIRLSVEDNGKGIDPADLPRVFDPFFTTKPVGKGTGLGLAVCRNIVEKYGGTIMCESEPGKGTRLVVELPQGPREQAEAGCVGRR